MFWILRNILNIISRNISRKLDIFHVPRTNTEYLEIVLIIKFC